MRTKAEGPNVESGSIFSAAMATATGYVALEAAQAEDTIGELVTLISRLSGHEKDPAKWWSSGEQLIADIRSIGDPELDPIAQLYAHLLPLRNNITHGLTLDDTGALLKRVKITKKDSGAASYEFCIMDIAARNELAIEFRRLERMAADAIRDAMDTQRTTASELPQRATSYSKER